MYNFENMGKDKEENSKILCNYLPQYLGEYPFPFLSIYPPPPRSMICTESRPVVWGITRGGSDLEGHKNAFGGDG